jgi:tetratricopeptide (TPR) repeat protein
MTVLRILALVGLAFSLGCASARINRENARAVAIADARVLEGCYDCLLGARTAYEQLVDARTVTNSKKVRTKDSVVVRLFGTNLLIALREKELALDPRPTLERARALVGRLPATIDPNRVFAIFDAVLPDPLGVPPDAMDALRTKHRPFVRKIQGELDWLARSPLRPAVREYVALSLDCSYWVRPRVSGGSIGYARKPPEVPPGAPPLIAYRTAICAGQDTAALTRVRAAVPRFHEAAYYAAQLTAFTSGETGDGEAALLLEQAYGRFPRAPGVTFLSGWFNTAIGDCPPAVRYFDETIAIEPAHERAYLERTVCLTQMHQDSAALESATRLIRLNTRSTAQAYYWRAVNRVRRKELALARSDIDSAKGRSESDNILTLAGIIEHDQNDIQVAERDLRTARSYPRGHRNCTAAWYLGSVLRKREVWRESAGMFETAMTCYDTAVAEIAASIAKIEAHPKMTAALKAKRIQKLVADSVDKRSRYYASAFNGANLNARDGNFARAEELLAIAAHDPELAQPVGQLREELKRAGPRMGQPARRQRR